ncbi:MAG: O-antigen ligase family protein [Nitrospiraceae bacterium]|nr:O-antigen ligase family protein [Nitrospiraceae bacterium]
MSIRDLLISTKRDVFSEKALFWSAWLLFFLIPIATSPAVIAGGLNISIWIFTGKFWKERGKWLNRDWTLPVLFFMLLPWAGLLWTNDLRWGLVFATKSYYWLYAFAAASLNWGLHKPKDLVNAFLSGLTTSFFIAMLQLMKLLPMNVSPTSFVNHISYSLLLVLGIMIASFYYARAAGRKEKFYMAFLMAAFFFNLSVTHGRAGYLAFVLLSPVIIFNIFGKKHVLKAAAALLAAIVLLFSAPMVKKRVNDAVSDINLYSKGDSETSMGLRFYFWKGAANIFINSPFLGAGTGGYGKAMEAYRTDPALPHAIQPHNSFLYMTASFGIFGLASIMWLFYVFLRKGWRARRSVAGFSVLAYGIILLIGSMTDTQILSIATAKLFSVLMGLETEIDLHG